MIGEWVHIVTNHPNGTLYTGVTSDVARLPEASELVRELAAGGDPAATAPNVLRDALLRRAPQHEVNI
jgi:hypothetical protein